MILRATVVRRLQDLLEAAAPLSCEVSRGVPRSGVEQNLIAVGDVEGVETTVPTLKAGRKATHDVFTIEVLCVAWRHGESGFDDVDGDACQLAAVVRDVLVEHPQLDHAGAGCPGVVSAHVSVADGPNPYHTTEGVASAARLEITVTTRD